MMNDRLNDRHLALPAVLYVRQSSRYQVEHNKESKRLQYGMEQRLRQLGWRDVEVIDEDLGRSATTTDGRTGFQRMVAEVCLGKVGAVAAREVSRFARNNRDWYQLIEMCGLVDTLLVDHEAIYDPRRANDRLLLGLKGSLSEYEIDLLRQRSLEARWAKARRGELLLIAPVGYIKSADQRLEKDPDRRVQRAIELVFEKFFELGSARQTLMWFIEHGLDLPARRRGPGGWETWWRHPAYRTVSSLLREPTYAGAYAYGKTEIRTQVVDGATRKTRSRKPIERWGVLLRDHHEGYISWEQFERAQKMLGDNSSQFFQAGTRGAPQKGPALLAGILRCRRCGRKLVVSYSGANATVPRYCCIRGGLDNGEPKCIGVGGVAVHAAVSREILRVVRPCAVDAAVLAITEKNIQQSALTDALLLELKAARYEADRASRQFDAVDPDNRLVADVLEQRWDAALEKVRQAEAKVEQSKVETGADVPVPECPSGLEEQLQEAWSNPETDVRLKKRIIRTLIEEIIVDIDEEASEVELVVHWKGGVHSRLRVRRRRTGQHSAAASPDTVNAIRVLARVCKDETIASFLNRNGLLTGRGNRWTKERVTALRSYRKIPRHTAENQSKGRWLNLSQAAAYVGVATKTLRRAVQRGDVAALHPLPVGPWVFEVHELDRTRHLLKIGPAAPAGPQEKQMDLAIPNT